MNIPMELDVWKGDWGLPSADLECLRVLTLCKFSGASFNVTPKNHTWSTPNGKLPVFRHYKRILSNFDTVSQYLAAKNMSPDHGLSEKQKADAVAFTMFLKDNLYPAFLHTWWLDEKNHMELTRKWYCKTMPFPLQFYYPSQYHKHAEKSLTALYPDVEDQQVLETELYDKAAQCISAISARLGTQEFIFGNHPTSVDATLFAYLALLVMVPFPNPRLKNLVNCCGNLIKYVKRISTRYFPAESKAYEAQNARGNTAAGAQPENKRLEQIIAVAIAVLAMGTYAVTTGLVKIPRSWFSGFSQQRRVVKIPIQYSSI